MNPNSGEAQQNIELPGLSGEELQADQKVEAASVKTPENKPQSVKASSQAASSIAMPAQDIAGQLTPTPVVTQTDDSLTQPANDTDRIEKEWVDKAKAIVAKTKDDPY